MIMCVLKMMTEYSFCFTILFYNVASLRENTVTSASDQDDADPEPEPGDAIDHLPAASSTTFAPPKGPTVVGLLNFT